MTKYWREISIILLLILVGFLFNRKPEIIETVREVEVERVVVQERVQYVDRNVHIEEKRPDGTHIVTIIKEQEKTDTKQTEQVEIKELNKHKETNKKHLAVDVLIPVDIWSTDLTKMKPDFKGVQVNGALRLLDTPVWGVVGVRPLQKELSLGLRVEF